MADQLRVVILKPSNYRPDGYVERFRWGFMPNSTVPYMRSMTPARLGGTQVEVHTIDEYVHTDLEYLSLLKRPRGGRTLLALVGVQSHQFHRALDLAAYARRNGCLAVIGGPHVMTCDTSLLHGRGVSFALAEAELVWREILEDAVGGGVATGLWRGRAMAAGAGGAGRRAARPARPAPLRHPDARPVPGPRVPVHVQLLLGDQDRRAADSQPEHRHHRGQPPRRQGGGRADDHVHLRQLQQVPRGRGVAFGHRRGAPGAGVLRAVRYADRKTGAPGGAAGRGRVLPDVRRRRVV